MVAVFYLVVIVLLYSLPAKRSQLPMQGPIYWVHIDGHHILSIFPVFVFAFTCAQNMLPVHNEIRSQKAGHFVATRKAIISSITLAGSVYLVSVLSQARLLLLS